MRPPATRPPTTKSIASWSIKNHPIRQFPQGAARPPASWAMRRPRFGRPNKKSAPAFWLNFQKAGRDFFLGQNAAGPAGSHRHVAHQHAAGSVDGIDGVLDVPALIAGRQLHPAGHRLDKMEQLVGRWWRGGAPPVRSRPARRWGRRSCRRNRPAAAFPRRPASCGRCRAGPCPPARTHTPDRQGRPCMGTALRGRRQSATLVHDTKKSSRGIADLGVKVSSRRRRGRSAGAWGWPSTTAKPRQRGIAAFRPAGPAGGPGCFPAPPPRQTRRAARPAAGPGRPSTPRPGTPSSPPPRRQSTGWVRPASPRMAEGQLLRQDIRPPAVGQAGDAAGQVHLGPQRRARAAPPA